MVEKEKEVVKAEVKKEVWVVGEVATQTQPVIVKDGESLDVYAALARILNEVEQFKGLLG